MADVDQSSKWLLGQSPQAWVQWVLQDSTLTVEAQLSTEFQYITRLSDSLLQVGGYDDPFLVLTEIQLRFDPHMPRRIRAYAALAEEKYHLLVYPIVFYLLPPGASQTVPDHYHSQLLGLEAHQDYVVIKAWELNAAQVVTEKNLVLLPFVGLMAGANEALIRQSVAQLRAVPGGERLETVLALFASFVLDVETIQQIVRWDMNVLRESPWYQEILEEGLRQGVEQGREEGQTVALTMMLKRWLNHRFQVPLDYFDETFQALDLAAITHLSEIAFDVDSLPDFEGHLAEILAEVDDQSASE